MSIFDKIQKAVGNVSQSTEKQTVTLAFTSLPESLAQMQDLPAAELKDPFQTAALTVSISLNSGLANGSYSTVVYIHNEYGQIYYELPVIIHVGQPVSDILRGDLNDDGSVDNLDVEYLLWHTLFPDDYTLNQDGDFTGDGSVDNLDVEYLLWHTLFPDDYPL